MDSLSIYSKNAFPLEEIFLLLINEGFLIRVISTEGKRYSISKDNPFHREQKQYVILDLSTSIIDDGANNPFYDEALDVVERTLGSDFETKEIQVLSVDYKLRKGVKTVQYFFRVLTNYFTTDFLKQTVFFDDLSGETLSGDNFEKLVHLYPPS
ncbi:MAG: hypothetical protein AB8F95_20245 [Bacteroidia bacterium]